MNIWEVIHSLDPYMVIAQSISVLAMFLYIMSGQAKEPNNVMRICSSGSFCMAVHFLMLGAFIPACVAGLASLRSLLMSAQWGRQHRNIIIPICIALSVGYGLYTASEPWMLLCLGGPICASAGQYMGDKLALYSLGTASSVFWLVNNILVLSIGGILAYVLIVGSFGLSTWREISSKRLKVATA